MAENFAQLDVPYSMEETRKAVMSIGPFKVPGPDGFQPVFFQSNWEVTCPTLHSFTSGVLEKCIIPVDAAKALLVVIPKEPNPISM